MKTFIQRIWQTGICVMMAVAILSSASCTDDDTNESYLGSMSVKLVAPENLEEVTFTDLTISILNTADGTTKTEKSSAEGTATFVDLIAGAYNVTVTGTTGDDIVINGVKNGVMVQSQERTEVSVQLVATLPVPEDPYAGLVIKEVFYSGESFLYDPFTATMMKDFFFELFNNSDKTIYLDGLYVADLWTPATSDSESAPTYSIREDPSLDHDYLYSNLVIRIPGSGEEHPLEPGKSFLVALNAINFKAEVERAGNEYEMPVDPESLAHIIDLSTADMETYAVQWLQTQGRDGNEYFDLDNPNVPNVENIYYDAYTDLFFMDMTGASLIVFNPEKELTSDDIFVYTYQSQSETGTSERALMKIPANCVIDGVDFVNNRESARWKRLPDTIDMGFGYIPDDDGGMTNHSQRRKIDKEASAKAGRCILQDTNNTTNDFEAVDPPTPKAGYEGYNIR